MGDTSPGIHGGIRLLTLIARIAGTLVAAFLILMFVAYAVNPGDNGNGGLPSEWPKMLLFPVGLCAGYLLAWRHTLAGGAIAIACLAAFLAAEGQWDMAPVMLTLGAPGILLIVVGALARTRRPPSLKSPDGTDSRGQSWESLLLLGSSVSSGQSWPLFSS